MKVLMAVCWCLLLCTGAYAADKWKSVEGLMLDGVPDNWQQTRLADEIEVNGLPMLIYEIEGPQPLREAAVILAASWAKAKWKVTTKAAGHEVQIVGVKDGWLKQANLSSNNRKQTQGYLSMSDLPARMEQDIDTKAPVLAKHLRKPPGTVILNEVRTVDMVGESILTTMTNNFDMEQNIAFYQEDRAAEAWKLSFKKAAEDNGGTVMRYVSPKQQEATYTFTRGAGQTFVVVNWITR
ncbi:hypothetical protein [Collimonas sp. OK412]|uniref:hypothetical protein n=1 Tax=Collimonas sp. (strain OK412) TaxID=1801619 RepID=UPI00111396B6|nr:hypothetical protein [Collimonas sp. OK412]